MTGSVSAAAAMRQEEQQFRFTMRINDPLKQWKLSPMDVEARSRWEDYTRGQGNHAGAHPPAASVVLPAHAEAPFWCRRYLVATKSGNCHPADVAWRVRCPVRSDVMTEEPQMLVQKLRVQRGWSQEQLAELTGLSPRTIQRIERGRNASAESLKAIAAVFEVDLSALREGDMQPSTTSQVSPEEALALAHVRRIKGFYLHLAEYGFMAALLAVMNVFISPHLPWSLFALIPWGFYLVVDGLRAFDKVPFLNGEWERRQVEKYLGREL
jgi:transcriptional regulator with XRE-family HTH domain